MPKRVVPEGEGKRVPVMTRTTQELRDRIEQAAAASGRSLAQEVEHRLEDSFKVNSEILWNIMETIKENKGKPVDLDFTITLFGAISRVEREIHGANSPLLDKDLPAFASALYRGTREPSHRESNIDDEAETETSQDKAPTPVAAPEEQAAWEPLTAPTRPTKAAKRAKPRVGGQQRSVG
jgi:hypothetical protein